MDTFTYFAYGSNMLAERLQKRCPSANFIGIAHIEGYVLAFNKKSTDGSGKATIARTTADDSVLYGVLYEISSFEGQELDRFEGRGYKKHNQFMVTKMDDGNELATKTYVAAPTSIDESSVSYDWYKELVLSGAQKAKLPNSHISRINSVPSIPDPILERKGRLDALDLLKNIDWNDNG